MKILPKLAVVSLILPYLLIQSCSSSNMVEASLDVRKRDSLQHLASVHIREMKEGVLLVRLPSRTTSVKALKNLAGERGTIDPGELREINKEAMRIISKKYTFTPVYFFYSGRSNDVLSGNYEGLFLDSALQTMKYPPDIKGKVFILDMDYVTLQGLGRPADGMQVSDGRFRVLSAPFPYFVKYNVLSVKAGNWRPFEEAVETLNKNLQDFYWQNRQ